MKYILITVKNISGIKITTEICKTKEEAYEKMKTALLERLKVNGDENLINMLENGIELSNSLLTKNNAYIFQDFGETSHHWKIIKV